MSKDIPSNSVAVGSPAMVICTYEEFVSKKENEMVNVPVFDESYTLRNRNFSPEMKTEMKEKLKKSRIGYVV